MNRMNPQCKRRIARPNARKAIARLDAELQTLIDRSPRDPDYPVSAEIDRATATANKAQLLLSILNLYR